MTPPQRVFLRFHDDALSDESDSAAGPKGASDPSESGIKSATSTGDALVPSGSSGNGL